MHTRRPVTLITFGLVTLIFCLGNRPDCDRRQPTLTCQDMNITVLPGTCVDITNPCDPSGDFNRIDGFRLCDAPDGIFVSASRSRSGTTRQICAAGNVAALTNEPATFIYAQPREFGEGGITITTTSGPPPLAVSVAASDTTLVHSSDPVDLTSVVTGGTEPYVYFWRSSPHLSHFNESNDASLPNLTVNPVFSVTYTLDVLDADGQHASDSVHITVLGVGVEVSASPTIILLGEPVNLSALVGGGVPPYTYFWSSDPAGQIDALSRFLESLTVYPTVDVTYTLQVTDSVGDTASASVDVEVLQLNVVIFISTPSGSNLVSAGDPVGLSAAVTGGTEPYSYFWSSDPAGQIDGLSRFLESPTVYPTVSVTYTVEVTDAGGLTGSRSRRIFVHLEADATATPSTINEGQSSTLEVSAVGGSGTYSFLWSTGETTTSIIVSPPVGDTDFTVTLSDGAGTPPASDTVTVTVNAAPPAGLVACFTWDNDPGLGVTTTFSSCASGGTITCISWRMEFELIPGDPNGWFDEQVDDGCDIVFGSGGGTTANSTFVYTPTEAPEPVLHRLTMIVDDGTGTFASVTQTFGPY